MSEIRLIPTNPNMFSPFIIPKASAAVDSVTPLSTAYGTKWVPMIAVVAPHTKYAPHICQIGADLSALLHDSVSSGPLASTACSFLFRPTSRSCSVSPSGFEPIFSGLSLKMKKAAGKANANTNTPRTTQAVRQ